MNKALIIIWLLFLVLGGGIKQYFIEKNKTPPPAYKAAKNLETNQQLSLADIETREVDTINTSLQMLLGRHLVREIKKGAPIRPEDLSLMPVVNFNQSDSSTLVFLNVSEEELFITGMISIGSNIFLCVADNIPDKDTGAAMNKGSTGNCTPKPLQVFAIHRQTAEVPGNWLILKAPINNTQETGRFIASKNRYIIIAP